MPLTAAELEPLLRLALVRGVGPNRLTRLVEQFGSADRVLTARMAELRALEGIGEELARRIRSAGSESETAGVRTALSTLVRLNAFVVARPDPLYPAEFQHLSDPPYLLYCVGDPAGLTTPSIAVVGTRSPTSYGRRVAHSFSEQLAGAGFAITSGMARGVDSEAHQGALAAGGMTVGVLGHGIDQIYPPECRNLFLSVREKGLLITEYPPGETPKSGNFPRRNRLIAALSEAVLVIEMGLRSGAQHTVNYAIEQGKEVLAVPGPVGEPMSEGTNRLIQDGAPLVALATDVIQILRGAGAAQLCDPRPAPPREEAASFPALSSAVPLLALYTDAERMLLSALSTHPAHIDSLSAETGLSIPEILVTLLELELRGLVTELPGKRFVRV